MDYGTIKFNFDHKLWGKPIVKMAVRKGVITKTQYEKITGEAYK